ncbi:MFS transporter [Thermomonospora amylolytica]|uniref:MFS transporter n=1 Tax=Thermomonospora amylolytica TaxID=1411117 RepID=UPI000E6CC4F8|nr:MDR family MFS transporter [Thermomonospora amylolytica]
MDAEREAAVTYAEHPAGAPMRGRGLHVLLGVLLLAMFLGGLDQTIVSTTLPTVAAELHGAENLAWVVTAYMLASTAFTPLWGKLGDQYGRKNLFLLSIVIFLAGSALCGMARNMPQLVAFRALQGVGGAGLMVLSTAIMTALVSPRERGRYQGIFGANFAASNVLGPLLGGFFVEVGWRWVFYINLPLGVLALIVIHRVLPRDTRYRRQEIDYAGMALLGAATVCLVLIATWGGTRYPWTSPVIWALAAGAVLSGLAWYASARRAREPVLPLRLFTARAFLVPAAVAFCLGVVMFCVMIYLPLFMQVVKGYSPLASGMLLPAVAAAVVASVGGGRLVTRYGRYKAYPIGGMALAAAGLLLLGRVDRDTGGLHLNAALVLVGFGLGAVVQVLITAAQNAVPYRDLGVATSGVTWFRSIGGAFGVAAFGALYNARLAGNIDRIAAGGGVPPGFAAQEAAEDPELVEALPGPVRTQFLDAFSEAIQTVVLWLAPVALVAALLALAVHEVPLRGLARAGPDLGEGAGAAPTFRSSRQEVAGRLSRLALRDAGAREMYMLLGAIADVHLPPGSMWALSRIAEEGSVSSAELARQAEVSVERGRPYVEQLVRAGYVVRRDGRLEITDAGRATVERLYEARGRALALHLAGWAPEERRELAALLSDLSRDSLDVPADLRVRAGR